MRNGGSRNLGAMAREGAAVPVEVGPILSRLDQSDHRD